MATGRVLEVGLGSGLNLPFYDREQVDFVWGLEPSAGMRRKAAAAIERADVEVRVLDLPGEEIPLDDSTVDTVVLTYTLCSIEDWRSALEQMRRVLTADGRVLFSEHGRAPDDAVRRWQHRLNPVWNVVAGGCHLDRPIVASLEDAGFRIDHLAEQYLGRPRAASYVSSGVCSPR